MRAFGGVFVILACLCVGPAHAHMHDRPDLNDWFEGLHNNQKGLCCSGTEGSVLSTDEIRTTEVDQCRIDYPGTLVPSHYCVRLEGQWWQVPDGSVVIVPNKYGPSLVWPVWYNKGTEHAEVYIRCFLPGALT